MARAAELQLEFTENSEGIFAALKNHDEKFEITDKIPKKIIVHGFDKEPISKEYLHMRAKEETHMFSEGEVGFIKSFISSQDYEISKQLSEIRRAIRKIDKFIKVKKIADDLLNDINRT